MKLTVKTIKGEAFKIDVELYNTIYQIKEKIQEAKSFNIECQKLIQKGNVIDDTKTVADYNMKEGDFVVVMMIKAPPKQIVPEIPKEEEKKNEMNIEEEQKKNIQTPSSNPVVIQPPRDLSMKFVTGAAYDQAIEDMIAMGFNKSEVVSAMMAAYNNPDRAIDFLINGIPQLEQEVLQIANQYDYNELSGQQGQGNNQEENARGEFSSQSDDSSNNQIDQEIQNQEGEQQQQQLDPSSPLYFLSQNPVFQQLKQQIQNNPQLLQAILSQLQQTNEQLYQLISGNQQEFMRLIHYNVQPEHESASQNSGSQNSESLQNSSAVSEEDEQAISRVNFNLLENFSQLCQLGFSREIVMQAFMLCGKDENMAANYLFEVDLSGNQQPQQEMQE